MREPWLMTPLLSRDDFSSAPNAALLSPNAATQTHGGQDRVEVGFPSPNGATYASPSRRLGY